MNTAEITKHMLSIGTPKLTENSDTGLTIETPRAVCYFEHFDNALATPEMSSCSAEACCNRNT